MVRAGGDGILKTLRFEQNLDGDFEWSGNGYRYSQEGDKIVVRGRASSFEEALRDLGDAMVRLAESVNDFEDKISLALAIDINEEDDADVLGIGSDMPAP